MRLFPEIRAPFGRRARNAGSPLTDEIDSGIRKILAEELLTTRPAITADERITDAPQKGPAAPPPT